MLGKARERHSPKSRTACAKVLRKVSCECVKELRRKKNKNNMARVWSLGNRTRMIWGGGWGPRHVRLCLGSVQFSSVAQSCPTLCDPMNHSTLGLPVHHQLLEFTQTHVH